MHIHDRRRGVAVALIESVISSMSATATPLRDALIPMAAPRRIDIRRPIGDNGVGDNGDGNQPKRLSPHHANRQRPPVYLQRLGVHAFAGGVQNQVVGQRFGANVIAPLPHGRLQLLVAGYAA